MAAKIGNAWAREAMETAMSYLWMNFNRIVGQPCRGTTVPMELECPDGNNRKVWVHVYPNDMMSHKQNEQFYAILDGFESQWTLAQAGDSAIQKSPLMTTRVHSTQALEGLLFTTFIALGILTELRKRMKATFETSTINSTFTIAELLARLKKIQVVTVEGKSEYLINVSGRDKRLIEALGFPGMFDSVENVFAPLHFLREWPCLTSYTPRHGRDFPKVRPPSGRLLVGYLYNVRS